MGRTSTSGRVSPASPIDCELERAATVAEAVDAIERRGAVPIAGATWVMRTGLRREQWAERYVALGAIPEMRELVTEPDLRIGACVTHAELAAATSGQPWLLALHQAAGRSANPAIRRVATVGGNLCAAGFAAADIASALLCLGAEVELVDDGGPRTLPLADFLSSRRASRPLVRAVTVPRRELLSGHARLPMRAGGGDYPVAIISAALALSSDAVIENAAVAVGSVEPAPRHWRELEQSLVGLSLDPREAARVAGGAGGEWSSREDADAPGWYRLAVLPALVGRAVQEVTGSWRPR